MKKPTLMCSTTMKRVAPRRPRHQTGFGLLELTIAVLIATTIGIAVVQRQVAQIENEFAQLVAAEFFAVQDAARVYFAREGEWPDEINGCADALDTLRDEEYLVGFDVTRWGSDFETECTGGPPAQLFAVAAEAPEERFARVTAARLIGGEVAATRVSSTIGLPGFAPLDNTFLSRIEVPGRPELNTMETNILMDGFDILGAGLLESQELLVSDAEVEQTLRWGDSQLFVDGARGTIDLGIFNGGGGGSIAFYFEGAGPNTIEARAANLLGLTGSMDVDQDFSALNILARQALVSDGTLDVGGFATFLDSVEMRQQLQVFDDAFFDSDAQVGRDFRVIGLSTFLDDVRMERDLEVIGEVAGRTGLFREDITACDDAGSAICALRVGPGGDGQSMAMGFDGVGPRIWAGGNPNNVMSSLDVHSLLTGFSGDVSVLGNIESQGIVFGEDVRTNTGDSLARAVQDVSIVPNGARVDKPVCAPSAPQPSIYLSVGQVAASDPAPPMHQILTFATDQGTHWIANIEVLTPDGIVSPPPQFGQIMAIVKCDA